MVHRKDDRMHLKWIGAALVIIACGGFGFRLAAQHIRQEKTLRTLIGLLDYMECELQYRMTPLPELCRQTAAEAKGVLCKAFLLLAQELEDQISPDVERCMDTALFKTGDIPSYSLDALRLLGRSLGRFDLEGQLKGLETVRQECRRNLEGLTRNQDVRLRGYQTLGLCAGAAVAILLI